MHLLVTNERTVVVRAPLRTTEREIREMVEERGEWVLQRLAVVAATPPKPPRAFVSGEVLLVDGLEVSLAVVRITARKRPTVRLQGDELVVTCQSTVDAAHIAVAVMNWYGERTLAALGPALAVWEPLVGVKPGEVIVRNQKRRWGSCASSGVIRLNWRLSMLPPRLLEYVVVHELAHMRQANHSPAFWAEVERAMSDSAARRAELRAYEKRIDW